MVLVLGVSGGLGHDAAAAVVRDGTVVAAVEEERMVRRKHAYGLAPIYATMYCLREAGATMDEVDYLALSWSPQRQDPQWPTMLHERLLSHPFFAGSRSPELCVVDHATAHAAAAFYCSGFPSATVLTADGQGDGVSTMIGLGNGSGLTVLETFGIPESLGFFYLALTNHLGFELGEEGKVMGLAAYGEPMAAEPLFTLDAAGYRAGLDLPDSDSDYAAFRAVVSAWRQRLEARLGPPNRPRYSLDPLSNRARTDLPLAHRDQTIAATGQAELERVLLHLVALAVGRTGVRRLALGGGVALNCTANGVLQRSGLVDELYVFPASGDAGTGLGAALAVAAGHGERPEHPIQDAGLGPSYSDETIADLLDRFGVTAERVEDPAAAAAELIGSGGVIGWFQARAEIGPRALGHRSILADPGRAEMHRRVNDIKGREQWRPLAPSIRAGAAGTYLEDPGPAPFMLTACQVRPDAREQIPAVVHVDGSCRPQLVGADNPRYARLLDRLDDQCGVPVVLNTSFNVAGEPIVCTPQDAIRAFYTSELDGLVIGSSVIRKDGRKHG